MTVGTTATQRVRRLSAAEIASYDLLPAEMAARVRVIRIPGLPGPYAGITLGRLVFLTRLVEADGRSRLLAHELAHVGQWSEQGAVAFLYRYLLQFFRGLVRTRNWQLAYLRIDAEVEARRLTDEWQHRDGAAPPARG